MMDLNLKDSKIHHYTLPIVLISFIFFAGQSNAQTLNPESLIVLRTVVNIENPAEFRNRLIDLSRTTKLNPRSLAKDAVRSTLSPEFGSVYLFKDAALRLLLAALFLEQQSLNVIFPVEAHASDLLQLIPADVVALASATNYPLEEDPIRYLFRRQPHLKPSLSGEYTAITLRLPKGQVQLMESSTVEFLGLGPVPKGRLLMPVEALSKASQGEHGSTRNYNLSALSSTIVAAKAINAVKQFKDPHLQLFAKIVGGMAFKHASVGDPRRMDYNVWTYFAQLERDLLAHLLKLKDPFLNQILDQVGHEITSSAFWARDFQYAFERYRRATTNNTPTSVDRLYGRWGQAMTLLALRKDNEALVLLKQATDSLKQAADSIGNSSRKYLYMVGALVKTGIVPTEQHAHFMGALDTLEDLDIGTEEQDVYDRDFLRILDTTGRGEIAIQHILRRLYELSTERKTQLEIYFLKELSAFLKDLAYLISFELGPRGEWVLRESSEYPTKLDFPNTALGYSESHQHGKQLKMQNIPYGMTNPEEDVATLGEFYFPIETFVDDQLAQPSDESVVSLPPGLTFAMWADVALTRTDPAPSIVPYLKLVWFEWFAQSFESLKSQEITPSTYEYSPLKFSQKTTDPAILTRLQDQSTEAIHVTLLETFENVRIFLEANYPKRPH